MVRSAASTARVAVRKMRGGTGFARAELDSLAVEEPLEIRLAWDDAAPRRSPAGGAPSDPSAAGSLDVTRRERPIAVTMRTPGHDRELAVGYLCAEGLIAARDDVAGALERAPNVVTIELRAGRQVDFAALERHSYVSSSCGLCGKASIDAVRVRRP